MSENMPAWGVVAVVLAVIGAATYLAAVGVLAGSAAGDLLGVVLGLAGATGVVHVTGKAMAGPTKGP